MAERSNWFVMRISQSERAQFAELARREGVPTAEAVRIAVRRTLQGNDRAPAKAEGVLASPRT